MPKYFRQFILIFFFSFFSMSHSNLRINFFETEELLFSFSIIIAER